LAANPAPHPHPRFDDAAIEAIVRLAAHRMATLAARANVVVLVVWPKPAGKIEPRPSGWCELGRLSDAFGRCWWTIHWHPERAEGRLLRERPRSKRGPLGEIAPP
jgi:hypothetical protein